MIRPPPSDGVNRPNRLPYARKWNFAARALSKVFILRVLDPSNPQQYWKL
jgi:hypothetical protein